MDDFTIEALTQKELPYETYESLEAIRAKHGQEVVPDCAAYLLSSAHLHAGRPLGRIGSLTGMFLEYAPGGRSTIDDVPRVIGISLPINEGLYASGDWQSRAIGRLILGTDLRRQLQGGLPTMSKNRKLGGSAR